MTNKMNNRRVDSALGLSRSRNVVARAAAPAANLKRTRHHDSALAMPARKRVEPKPMKVVLSMDNVPVYVRATNEMAELV